MHFGAWRIGAPGGTQGQQMCVLNLLASTEAQVSTGYSIQEDLKTGKISASFPQKKERIVSKKGNWLFLNKAPHQSA